MKRKPPCFETKHTSDDQISTLKQMQYVISDVKAIVIVKILVMRQRSVRVAGEQLVTVDNMTGYAISPPVELVELHRKGDALQYPRPVF
jgi:hypothetical protein